jgi:glycerol kinase
VGRADHILAIDQGTTSTRAILFDAQANPVAVAQRELKQHYPQPGWVEHDPEDIWRDALAVAREALIAIDVKRVAGIGIANQRETAIIWDRATGEPIHRALVWQDRRTAERCARLKIAWMLDHVPCARDRAAHGELAAGTIDSFLLWRLTGGAVHATDVTNASRTSLFDIRANRWDEELCRIFGVPEAILPEVHDNSRIFGTSAPGLFDAEITIAGMTGDQQAALFGQACFAPGMAKSTYGTGCFVLLNTGGEALQSRHRLLTTPAWRIGGQTTFALEGSIFVAGAAVKWLRDALGVIGSATETERLAAQVPDSHGVYMIPAFVGLGAPHWDPDARGAITGLTLDAGFAHLARAALEAVAYQTLDLVEAMKADGAAPPAAIRLDGGMAANAWLCQFLADILQVSVERPCNLETTALGAAFHAGLATGVWPNLEVLSNIWTRRDAFEPQMASDLRHRLVEGWRQAVAKTLSRA